MTAADRDVALRTLEHEIALLLRRVRRGVAERAVELHPDLHSTSYSLLLTLVDHGPRRAADLADMFALDKGAVSRAVKQLLALGFVERTPDPNDGRAGILTVTPTAEQKLAAVVARRRQELGVRLSDWEPGTIEELADRLARFNHAISAEEGANRTHRT